MTAALILLGLFGLVVFCGGAFYAFGMMMSDAPAQDSPTGGCIVAALGLVCMVVAIGVLIARALS